MSYILVMYIYAGMLAKGDSVALLSIDKFSSQADCVAAGEAGRPLVNGSSKEYRFVCLPRKV